MRLGEVLGMAISDFVMGRGGTAYIEVVPRAGNPNGARVKMMRPRRIYVGADLERLFADYLTHLACRAAGLGMTVLPGSPLLVNLDRPPLLATIREGTVRDKVTALKNKGIGPAGWTPHWFRHSHASALLGLPVHVLQRYAGHATPTMAMYYVAQREEHAEQAFLATVKLKADGTRVAFSREDHDTIHLLGRADRILPNGWCLLPPLQSCGKGNAVLDLLGLRHRPDPPAGPRTPARRHRRPDRPGQDGLRAAARPPYARR